VEINKNIDRRHWGTIIIGAGQAGLATGYYLQKSGENFLIIDMAGKIGDSWRKRWDSLRLFTPAQYDGLPGLPFPASRNTYPSKDKMAGYLAEYADKFNLPVRMGVSVSRLSQNHGGFEVATTDGIYTCDRVVVATGTNPVPHIPDFAKELDPSIRQIHSSQYANPASLPEGIVLVIGAGTSGVEIAIDLSGSRQTLIAGHPTFHIPDQVFRFAGRFYWWFISNVLTMKTPMGRNARKHIIKGGSPLIRVTIDDVEAAGVVCLPRVAGVSDGQPRLEDGRVIPVSAVVWSTGYRPDFSWIDMDVTDSTGWPVTQRGIIPGRKGLYFVGMLFQFSLTSGLVGGVGRDAAFISRHIVQQIRS
jgi:putative flavoprotein involved in K+ transport